MKSLDVKISFKGSHPEGKRAGNFRIKYARMILENASKEGGTMKSVRLKVDQAEEWQKMVNEAAEEAYNLLNSDKRRA